MKRHAFWLIIAFFAVTIVFSVVLIKRYPATFHDGSSHKLVHDAGKPVPGSDQVVATERELPEPVLRANRGAPFPDLDGEADELGLSDSARRAISLESRVMHEASKDYDSLLSFYKERAAHSEERSAEVQAFEWMLTLCDDIVYRSQGDMSDFIGIQGDPKRMEFYLLALDYCLGGLGNWDAVKVALEQNGEEGFPVIGGDHAAWFDFGNRYGRRALLDEAANKIKYASSLSAMVSAFGALETAGYLYSGEAGPEVPLGESKIDQISISWIVPMLYFCNVNGGCGRAHPFTLYHCTFHHCDDSVQNFSAAVYRSSSMFQVDVIEDLYGYFIRLRREGAGVIEIDPEVINVFGH